MATCEHQTFRGSYWEPAEYCENEPAEGEDYCPEHGGADEGIDPDYARDLAIDRAMEDAAA